MPIDLDALCDDLLAERADLFAILDRLGPDGWMAATPAPGWRVLDQVTHLAHFDDMAALAMDDPARFRAERDAQRERGESISDAAAAAHASTEPTAAATWLRASGAHLVASARAAGDARVPWYGPDMTAASSLTARLMETWAHAQDVADAVGAVRAPTERLRHVAFIGYRAFANSFVANGLDVPEAQPRVELAAPDGSVWAFGADDASEVVSGTALDFCLLVTRRRHRFDTELVATGAVADRWLDVAQAFAGPPGVGRQPSAQPSANEG